MVKIDTVVTRGGDKGDTSLGDGSRVGKDYPRVEAYGTVDEANAHLGLVRLYAHGDREADAMLERIQQDLFDLGADLCVPGSEGEDPKGKSRLRISATQIGRLEGEVAAMTARIPPLTSFVLPGGSPGAAHAHVARTVVRRAERLVVALARSEAVNPDAIRYLNRLSDHLFVLARRLNRDGQDDVLWVPGATR